MFKFKNLIVVMLSLCITLPIVTVSFSAEDSWLAEMSKKMEEEGCLNQGDLAVFLVNILGAQGFLPPAATIQDYFDFLEKIGVVPPQGWDENSDVTKEQVCYMSGVSAQECETTSCGKLLERLKWFLSDRLARFGLANYNSQEAETEPIKPPISP